VVVFVISWVALARPRRWEEWLNAVIGLWLIVAPFVLGFSSVLGATWNHVIVGVLIGADAISVLARSRMQTVTQA
jgi:hypothetical protein